MAYPYYPNYQQYYPYMNQNANLSQNQPQNQQIQNGGFVSVRSEDEARNYPVAPGNSVTFRNESEPYIYTKTMGFSQLDRPVFDKYRLVKEEQPENVQKRAQEQPSIDLSEYARKEELEALRAEIDKLKEKKKGKAKDDE